MAAIGTFASIAITGHFTELASVPEPAIVGDVGRSVQHLSLSEIVSTHS